MSFTSATDPAYLRWVQTNARPSKRVPSWRQANALLELARKKKGVALKTPEAKQHTKTMAENRKVASLSTKPHHVARQRKRSWVSSVDSPVIEDTKEGRFITVNSNMDPEKVVIILESSAPTDADSFHYRRLDGLGAIHGVEIVKPYTRDNVKGIVYGHKNSRVSGDDNAAAIQFVFKKHRGEPVDFNLSDSITGNCVLNAIRDYYGNKMTQARNSVLRSFFEKYHLEAHGVNKEIMGKLAKKLRLRLVVRNAINKTWFDSDAQDKLHRPKVEFFAANDHASTYVPIGSYADLKVAYCADIVAETKKLHQLKRYFAKISNNEKERIPYVIPDAIWTDGTIYKSFKPSSVSGNVEDDARRSFFLCTNADQFRYKHWVRTNKLRPLRGAYFDIFRNADTYLTVQRFSDAYTVHSYDMNRAYPSFRTNPLFPKYKLTVGNVCLYNSSTADLSAVLDLPGVSYVSSITWSNDFVKSCGWVHDNQWYNHIILFTLVSRGWATITVSMSCVCRESADLEFPFTADKFYNNAFIGRLVCGASAEGKVEYTKVYPGDLPQVLYDYKSDSTCRGRTVVYPGSDGEYVCATLDMEDTRCQLHQIHGCIIAYQQVEMMKAMVLASGETTVVAYNTDGFHTLKTISLETSLAPGKFKYECKSINYCANGEGMPKKTFEYLWELSSLPDFRVELPVTLTIGPAGCGKSYTRIEVQPGVDAVVVCPLNELVVNTKSRTVAAVQTYHKYFGMHAGGTYRELEVHEVVIADEVSMVTGDDLRTIIDTCKKRRVCLDLIGDVRLINGKWDTDQMLPVEINENGITWDEAIRGTEFTVREIISDVRRQNEEDSAFCDGLRGMNLREMRVELLRRFGKRDWKDIIHPECLGLSAQHKRIHLYNNSVLAKFPVMEAPARCIKTKKKNGEIIEAKGTIRVLPLSQIWCERKTSDEPCPKKYSYELAFFRTANAVQGQSIATPYIIDIDGCSARFLYTAISRCRSLDLITLVISGSDWGKQLSD